MRKYTKKDWYKHKSELEQDQHFITRQGYEIVLDRPVAGDATKWYCADVIDDKVFYCDGTVEPGDLVYKVES